MIAGGVTVSRQAVRSLLRAATAEAYSAPARDVRAWVDEAGAGFDARIETRMRADGVLFEAATTRRAQLVARAGELTGIAMPALEVRVTGLVQMTGPR